MTKTEARRNSIAILVDYVNEKETKFAEKDLSETKKIDYPYSCEDVEELSYGNMSVLWKVMPENSYIQHNGEYRFSEQAVLAIKAEMSKWK